MDEEQMMKELCKEMDIRWIPEKGHSTIRGKELTAEQFADITFSSYEQARETAVALRNRRADNVR